MTFADNFQKINKAHKEALLAFSLAIVAATLIKVPSFLGVQLGQNESFYIRNLSFFVLPALTIYFAWKQQLKSRILLWLASAFSIAGIFANVYPFKPGSDTEVLLALHLPISLWLIVGIAFTGGRWKLADRRMDFVRFTGELFIYYVLIALGGGVLTGFMALIFGTINIDIEPLFESWLLPCGATGAFIIASWLVETQKEKTVNIAPLLARLFSPLFAIVLITFLGVFVWTGRVVEIEREMLIAFDLLLVVVLGLLLYYISARDPGSPASAFDVVQVVLIISALLVDALALWAIFDRIVEFGFTPNRVAALGMNLILLVNLAWSGVLYTRFLRGNGSFSTLEKWQMNYLPVYAVWAAIVAITFPLLFDFM